MILKQSFSAAAILFLFGCSSTQSQQPSPTPTRADEVTSGAINGKVVNESGQPLQGAAVFVGAVNSSNTGRTTWTDSDGNFQVNGLAPALYKVSAILAAYVTAPAATDTTATYYRIGDSVKLGLVRGGVITGTVTNAGNEPIAAIRVHASMVRDAQGQRPTGMSFAFLERQTDDRGIYRIYGVTPGTYLVSAGGSATTQSFQFDPYDSDAPTYAPSSTQDNAAEVNVRAGEESNVDIRYRGEPGHSISGAVRTMGTSGSSIALTPIGIGLMATVVSVQLPGSRGFAFTGVADGDYEVVAQEVSSSPTSTLPELAFSEPRRITVKGTDVAGIELVTKPLASLSGRIVLEPSRIAECQGKRRPSFAETLVALRRNEKDAKKDLPLYLRLFASSASPDQTGAFVLRNIMPSRYQFDPQFNARYWYLQSITIASPGTAATNYTSANSRIDAATNWTVVKTGDKISSLTITIAEGAASIRGRLSVSEGSKLPSGLSVYLAPTEREKSEDVLRFFVTAVAADGTFAFSNLPPGRYWILAQTSVNIKIPTQVQLRLPEAAEARTKLRRAGEILKTDIDLKPCQNITDYQLPLI
jgi:hypothetical protein